MQHLLHPRQDGGFGQQEAKPKIIKQELHMTIDRSRASTLMLAAVMAAQLAANPLFARGAEVAPAVAYLPATQPRPLSRTPLAVTDASQNAGQILVAGPYFLTAAPNKHIPFTTKLTAHPAK
jgi:hypothetical protein